jgi:oligoendopeptidase F
MAKPQIKETEWNLKLLFNGDDDPAMEVERNRIEQETQTFVSKWNSRDEYLTDPAVLKEALDEYEKLINLNGRGGKEGYYFGLRTAQDEANTTLKAKENKIDDFKAKQANLLQFFPIRVAKIEPDMQSVFLTSDHLAVYKHYLESLFLEAKYLLSEDAEKVMNLKASSSYSNWVRMTSTFLSKEEREVLNEDGKKEILSYSKIYSLMQSTNKNVRDGAAAAINEILEKHVDVAEAEINAILGDKKVNDELRGMPRPDFERHLGDDIESDVVDALVESIAARNDISRKYYGFKARLLGQKKLEYHERSVPYGVISKKYSYEDSVALIYEVFTKLDPEFGEIFAGFVNEGRIDVYPRKGKSSGAFCTQPVPSMPVYSLLNHTDKLNDVLTIAHEMGHGINHVLINKSQNALNSKSPMCTAEVASTFMEDFVLQRVLEEADDELRLTIMVQKLDDDTATIIRQNACYRFEQELHASFRKTGYLSKDDIGELFQKHMSAYMGDFVEMSEGSKNWWVLWPHIRYFFYVYSYASGLLISKSLQSKVKNDPSFILKVKEFLSAGSSDSPKNIFAKLGIDITDRSFWEVGLQEVEALLQETEALAKKLGKI